MASGYRFLRNGLLLLLTGTLLLPVLFSGCRSHKKKSGKAKYAANRGAKVQKNGIMPDTRLKARNGREARKEAQEVIKKYFVTGIEFLLVVTSFIPAAIKQ